MFLINILAEILKHETNKAIIYVYMRLPLIYSPMNTYQSYINNRYNIVK